MHARATVAIWLGGAVLLAGCAGQPISVVNSLVTTSQNAELEKPTPQSIFALDDVVHVVVYVTWPDVKADGGRHHVEWNWYRGSQLVSHAEGPIRFNFAPAALWTSRPASAFGAGSYKVDTILDGNLMSTNTFLIKP